MLIFSSSSPTPPPRRRRSTPWLLGGVAATAVIAIGSWVAAPEVFMEALLAGAGSEFSTDSGTSGGPDETQVPSMTGNETDDGATRAAPGQSTLWTQYHQIWSANRERPVTQRQALPLPDFSRAGYHQGDALPPRTEDREHLLSLALLADVAFKRFDVTDYGAQGDDMVSDRSAVLRAHAAMRKWQRAGETEQGRAGTAQRQTDKRQHREPRRGELYFPAGDYVLYGQEERDWFHARMMALKAVVADETRQQTLREALLKMQGLSLAGDHWRLAGAGSDRSHLLQTAPMLPLHPGWYWSTPWLLHLGNLEEGKTLSEGGRQEAWQPLAARSIRQPADTQRTVMLAGGGEKHAGAPLAVGDEILLESIDKRPQAVARALAPYQMERDARTGKSRWLVERDGVVKRARYRITARKGRRLTLSLPMVHERFPGEQWRIARIHPAHEVGVEGVTLRGNWHGTFKHHRSAEDDSGFGLLDIDGVTDGWVRDVHLDNFNQGVKVRHSSQTTLEDVTMTGNPGHIAMTISDSNQVLARRITDQSHAWHAPGVARYATHNVYLQMEHAGDSGIELHGQQSRDNLFDQKRGGHVRDRWGASVGHQPNHLRGLVLWNPVNTGQPHDAWPFMRADSHFGKVIMPTVAGASGRALGIASRHDYERVMNAKGVTDYSTLSPMSALQARVESLGKAVKPASLYQAQRALTRDAEY